MSDQKLGLKETREMHQFLSGVLADFAKHKSDDGKVDAGEWLKMAGSNAPAGVRAVMGMDRIDDEIKDLDEKETQEIAAMGVDLMRQLSAIFLGVK